MKVYAGINRKCVIEGRYPEFMPAEPELKEAQTVMQQGEALYQWLIKQL